MLYSFSATIPANTTDASPLKQKLPLTAGKITYIDVTFPAGCNGLVKVRIFRQGSQIVPLSSAQYLIGNAQTIRSDMNETMATGTFELEFQGSSPTSGYPHTLQIGVNLEPLPMTPQASQYNSIEEYLYRICVGLNVHDGLKPIAGFGQFNVAPIFPYPTWTPPPSAVPDPNKLPPPSSGNNGTTPPTGDTGSGDSTVINNFPPDNHIITDARWAYPIIDKYPPTRDDMTQRQYVDYLISRGYGNEPELISKIIYIYPFASKLTCDQLSVFGNLLQYAIGTHRMVASDQIGYFETIVAVCTSKGCISTQGWKEHLARLIESVK